METIRIFDPVAPVAHQAVVAAVPVPAAGPVVVLHNNKPNAEALLAMLGESAAGMGHLGPIEVERKRWPSEPAPPDLLEAVAGRRGLVLTGTAD
jgi:hypothetical protein